MRAIIIGHAHLDHVGGVPFLAKRYKKAKIFATAQLHSWQDNRGC
ncbi:MAG: MBL fold metallo-hydrolase [Promethearchaeota archaeon]